MRKTCSIIYVYIYIFECNYGCSVDNEFEKILIFDWDIYVSCFTLMSRFYIYIYIEREYREIDKDGNLLHVRIVRVTGLATHDEAYVIRES